MPFEAGAPRPSVARASVRSAAGASVRSAAGASVRSAARPSVEGSPYRRGLHPRVEPSARRRALDGESGGTVTVGVLGLQGGVSEHVEVLDGLGVRTTLLRTPRDLLGPDGLRVDAVVLPGGESSVIDRLLRTFGLFDPLRTAIAEGLPTLGTCAGLILLAGTVLDPAPGQQSLAVLDATVRRNAFGSQVDSAEVELETSEGTVSVAFIRAPQVVACGPQVAVIARRGEAIVGVRQGAITGLAFHPEVTGEARFHQRLIADVRARTEA